MHLLVGLGNPGPTYAGTRHNVGFMFLDTLASESGVSINQTKFRSLYAKGTWQGYDLVFLKPQTYMNLSGGPVQEALAFFKLPPERLIVVFDDLDLAAGAVKLRVGGGAGGHNGVKDILAKLGNDKFHRIKLGIGKPEHKSATADWVLSRFSPEELSKLESESFAVAKERLTSVLKQAR